MVHGGVKIILTRCGPRHGSERGEALATRESAAGTEAGRRVEYCAISGIFFRPLLLLGLEVPGTKDEKQDGREGDRDHHHHAHNPKI